MATKLPLRFRILLEISKKPEMDRDELMELLRHDYGSEGQFKAKIMDDHLEAMRAVGLIDDVRVELDEKGALVRRYSITSYGEDRLKYLPKGA